MNSREESTSAILQRQHGSHDDIMRMLYELKVMLHSSFVNKMKDYFTIELDEIGRITYCKSIISDLELGLSRKLLMGEKDIHGLMDFLVKHAERVTAPISNELLAEAYNDYSGMFFRDDDVADKIQILKHNFEGHLRSRSLSDMIRLAYVLQAQLSLGYQQLVKQVGRARIVDGRIRSFLCKNFQLRLRADDSDSKADEPIFTPETKESKGCAEQIFEALGSACITEVETIAKTTGIEKPYLTFSTCRFLQLLQEFLAMIGSPLLTKFEEEIKETFIETNLLEKVSVENLRMVLEMMFESMNRAMVPKEVCEDSISAPFIMLNFSIMLRDCKLTALADLRAKAAKFIYIFNGSKLVVPVPTLKHELLDILDRFAQIG